ncbi:S-layer homology domain-containing protein [bacterium CPR1]|nr:S-layer homology domain-containing protein [bacterium CPR1]
MNRWTVAVALAINLLLPARAEEAAPPWAQEAVKTLRAQGIMRGYLDGSLHGSQAITRYELVELLDRVERQDQGLHDQAVSRESLQELEQVVNRTRQSMDELGGNQLDNQVDRLQLRLEELGRP